MPSLNLDGATFEELVNVLLDAFDSNTLKQLLTFRLDKNLEEIASPNQSVRNIVFKVIERAEAEGWTRELATEAHQYNPGNQRLAAFCENHIAAAPPEVSVEPGQEERKRIETPIFGHGEILQLHALLLKANLGSEDSQQVLQGGMNLEFRATLPTAGSTSARLLNTLHILNSTGELIGGEIPFHTFLANAVHLAGPLPESAELERFMQKLST